MAITVLNPRKIHLGGPKVAVNVHHCTEAITPGMLVMRHVSSGIKVKKSTRTGLKNTMFAVEASMLNTAYDVDYASGDLVECIVGAPGTSVYAIIASGANIAAGARLTDAGNGKLKAVGSDTPCCEALESVDNSAGPGDARIRVECV